MVIGRDLLNPGSDITSIAWDKPYLIYNKLQLKLTERVLEGQDSSLDHAIEWYQADDV